MCLAAGGGVGGEIGIQMRVRMAREMGAVIVGRRVLRSGNTLEAELGEARRGRDWRRRVVGRMQ